MVRRRAIRRRQQGVTLIELLVVMTILAFMTTIAVFNMPPSRGSAKIEAERFAARMRAAEQTVIAANASMRIDLTAKGYQFMVFEEEEWKPFEAQRFKSARRFPAGVDVLADFAGTASANERKTDKEEDAVTELIIDPIGMAQPYSVIFSDGRERWRVSGGGGDGVMLEADAK